MIVKIKTVAALTWSLPSGQDQLEFDAGVTVQNAISALVKKHGASLKDELLSDGELKKGLCLLVSGRNVLSLPDRFDSTLKDGDELIISVIMAGG